MKNIIITASLFLLIGLSSFAQGYQVGDKATDFKLKNIDDTFVSLKNYPDAKGFIVIFTCNHCPFSVAYEDRIISLDKEFKLKGYPVIAINPNDPAIVPSDGFDEMKLRAKEKGFTFLIYLMKARKYFRFTEPCEPLMFMYCRKLEQTWLLPISGLLMIIRRTLNL